jgi:DNA/RNA-binding domain of Phe-tRNA-synthetase-like protein
MVLADRTGPFGNPSSDSLRTSTGDHTRNILQVIFFSPEDKKKEVILESSENLYKRFVKIPGPVSYII